MKQKTLALLLVLVLVLSVLPANIFAAAPVQTGTLEFRPGQALAPAALPEAPAETNGQYKVTLKVVSGSDHGQAELVDSNSGDTGEAVYFTATPDPGYLVEVGGKYEGTYYEPELLYAGYNLYAVILGDGDVDLEVSFVKAPGSNHDITVVSRYYRPDDAAGRDCGTVEVSVTEAKEGESVFLLVTPNADYQYYSAFATDSQGHDMDVFTVIEDGDQVYLEMFMPARDVTVYVEFWCKGPFSFHTVLNGVTFSAQEDVEDESVKVHVQARDGYQVGEAFATQVVDIKATPKPGYKVQSVTSGDAEIIPNGENAWYFIMPNHEVTFDVVTVPTINPVSVTVQTGLGGVASLDKTEALAGETVTLTCIPQEGYRVAQILGAEVTYQGEGVYTFVMPDRAVELQVLFLRNENPFLDVTEDRYFYAPILWAVEQGLTNGMTPTTFEPETTCTRSQVVTFLWRWMGSPEPETTETPFVDLVETAFYYKAVLWAVEKGITNGMTATTFEPEGTCTRAQVVTLLHRALGTPEPESTEHPFTDLVETAFYYKAVLWAVEQGLTNGMTATTFEPETTCTRSQVVTFLYRAT